MHSLADNFLDALRFEPQHMNTVRALGRYQGKQELYSRQTPEVLESLRRLAVVESSESSNRLEGIVASRQRIEDLVTRSATPRDRSEQEIAGYRDALALIHESYGDMPVRVNVLLQLHSTLFRYVPQEGGRFKPVDNEIVERDSDGRLIRVRFKATSAVETPQAMAALEQRYEQTVHRNEPLVVIPLTILDFLCIHPFLDGNGRMARLVTLLLLYRAGFYVGRYISLERIFEESRQSYYETLEASSQGWHQGQHDVFPWMTYFWGVLLRAYKELEERVGSIVDAPGAKTLRVRQAVERRVRPFAISDIERDCPGVSRPMIRRVLRQLRDEGRLVVEGSGRGARWRRLDL